MSNSKLYLAKFLQNYGQLGTKEELIIKSFFLLILKRWQSVEDADYSPLTQLQVKAASWVRDQEKQERLQSRM